MMAYRSSVVAVCLLASALAVRAPAAEAPVIQRVTERCGDASSVEARETTIRSDAATLAATVLWRPGCVRGGAVLIQGSGASDRGNRWAASVAHLMASLGVATVFPDKRGSGASGGDWLDGGYELLAADALAAVAHLRESFFEDLEAPVGLVGLSEGGRVAPIAASREGSRVGFVVAVSSAVVPFLDALDHEVRNTYREWGLTAEEEANFLAVDAAVVRFARTGGADEWTEYEAELEKLLGGPQAARARGLYPTSAEDKRWRWFRQVMHNDPLKHWQEVEAPAFFALGEEDEAGNVPVRRSVELLERTQAPHQDWEIHRYAGSGHGLWEPGQRGRTLNLAFQRDLQRFVERVLEPH